MSEKKKENKKSNVKGTGEKEEYIHKDSKRGRGKRDQVQGNSPTVQSGPSREPLTLRSTPSNGTLSRDPTALDPSLFDPTVTIMGFKISFGIQGRTEGVSTPPVNLHETRPTTVSGP